MRLVYEIMNLCYDSSKDTSGGRIIMETDRFDSALEIKKRRIKRIVTVSIVFLIMLLSAFRILSYQYPILRTGEVVGDYHLYYIDMSKAILCDVAYFEVVVFEDEEYEYLYDLHPVGGSCVSNLFIWDSGDFMFLKDAIDAGLISQQEFLDSEVVVIRAK